MILVQLPEDARAIDAVLPRSRPITTSDLPLVTRVTDDLDAAHDTAHRLRQAGARVVIVEEPIDREGSAFCTDHPAQLAARECERCNVAICPGCMVHAKGEPRCVPCQDAITTHRTRTRRRQLVLLLIFSAFLYKVWDHFRLDTERMESSAPITIGVIQFAPKADTSANIIRNLNYGSDAPGQGRTLRDLAPWINAEFSRYSGSPDARFRVDIRGPFAVDVNAPALAEPGDSWFTRMVRAVQYPRYFQQLAADHGVNASRYTVKVYVVYGGSSYDMASHSRGSETGRVAVVYVSLDELNPGYPLATIAHEIGHTLGADDTYDPETSRAIHPEGFVEPFSKPLFPQSFAELMAVDVPISRTREMEVSTLDQIRVGHRSAADMGWISAEQADLFYTPAEKGPEDRLVTEEPEPAPQAEPEPPQGDSG